MSKKLNINHEHSLNDLTSISAVTMPITKQLLGARGMMQADLLTVWNTIVGTDMAAYSLPQKLVFPKNSRTDGCLTIMVPTGAFAMEISQNEQQIIDKINAYFGYPAINKLRILQNGAIDDYVFKKKAIDKVKKNVVSDDEESYITELTKDIALPELKKAVAELGRAIFTQQKKQE